MSQLDQIMTSEAVAIESRPASVMTRVLATLLDYLFYGVVVLLVVAAAAPVLDTLNDAQGNTIMVVLIATIMVILPTTIETLTLGRSLGKMANGTRVVRDDGGPITFRHAITRWSVAPIELFITFGMVAFTIAMLSPRSKRLGDVLAGTYVARIRGVEEYEYPLIMPPELEAWAGNADMRSLPDKVSMYARKYLARTGGLSPETRQRLGLLLAAEIEKYVQPAPPAGTNPERFIAAVLVTRRDREYLRALRQRERDNAERASLSRVLPWAES